MYLEFKKLESDPKKGHIIQFSLEEVHTVSSRNFIAIKRPLLNIDSIERSIRSNYREQIEKGLFSDVVAKQCDEEIKNAIETERQRILALPHPIILDGVVKEAKYID
ncbi:MAG: hypothetical protein LBU27_02865 [Candidatus Peribacteria bacterium]|jgi:hypothetical protein|nr:hypothetical protein [Candidatus Peribacteria bacterium]